MGASMNMKSGFRAAAASALVFAALLLGGTCFAQSDLTRVKDLGKVQGWRDNALVGYGIVTGLAGTGDSPGNRVTRQALANVYSQFNLTIPSEQVQSRNVAIVMVSASLSPFARSGDTLDVTVTSAGDARSLLGGSLLLTPLKGADGEVHALAQGALTVGGYRYDANGNVVQKNHPTLGAIPGGATVEVGVEAKVMRQNGSVTFVLAEPDYTTASRVARAINSQFRTELARPRDASGIDIEVPPADRARLVDFLAKVENVSVEPDRRARVVINERTGTLVSGGDVRISSVSISHGDLKLSIASQSSVSQPLVLGRAGDGVQTALVTNTQIDVDEPRGAGYVKAQTTVADLVQALSRMKIGTRDMISILRAVKAAGALHGELVVQ
jgi:flagellar P-ring protein precursor FlgI